MASKRRYSLNKNSTKLCTQCGEYKNVAEFGWVNKREGWKQSKCRHCNRKRNKEAYAKRKAPIIEYLKNNPCVDCGESDWRVLEFDHVKGEKLYNVSEMWKIAGGQQVRLKLLSEEIAKCEIRCKNHHAIRHWDDEWGGGRPVSNKDAIEFYNIEEDEEQPQLQMRLFD